jgi:hypothetical protein
LRINLNPFFNKDFWFVFLTSFAVLVLYGGAVINKVDIINYGESLAMFNVTFSVGLGAIIIAAMTFIQKSQTKELKPQIIKFINEFVAFILLNFLLLMASKTNFEWITHIFLILTFITTLVIILGTRSFLKMYLEKIKPDEKANLK